MKNAAPLLMWILVTLLLVGLAVLAGCLHVPSFAALFGFLALLAGMLTQDELHIYRRNKARKAAFEPLTQMLSFRVQTKRDVR